MVVCYRLFIGTTSPLGISLQSDTIWRFYQHKTPPILSLLTDCGTFFPQYELPSPKTTPFTVFIVVFAECKLPRVVLEERSYFWGLDQSYWRASSDASTDQAVASQTRRFLIITLAGV